MNPYNQMRRTNAPTGCRSRLRPSGGLHALVAFDICSFNDPSRTHEDLVYLHTTMYDLVEAACGRIGVPWQGFYREDRGDGLLLVAPGGLPTSLLAEDLVAAVRSLLMLHNRRSSEAVRLRLRMSLHAGHVTHNGRGVVGRAANQLFRALDAPEFKNTLAGSSADLGVIVSAYLYEEVVRGLADGGSYLPLLVQVKETTAQAWGYFPEGTWRPSLVPLSA